MDIREDIIRQVYLFFLTVILISSFVVYATDSIFKKTDIILLDLDKVLNSSKGGDGNEWVTGSTGQGVLNGKEADSENDISSGHQTLNEIPSPEDKGMKIYVYVINEDIYISIDKDIIDEKSKYNEENALEELRKYQNGNESVTFELYDCYAEAMVIKNIKKELGVNIQDGANKLK